MDAQISAGDLVGKGRLGLFIPPFAKCREGWGTPGFLGRFEVGRGFCGWFEAERHQENSVGRAGRLSVDRGDWGVAETSAVG
jgi:hypothetical protein